jgi:hypothetical protein
MAVAAVSSLHNKYNFNGTNITTMDLAETKDWKDMVKEESVLGDKNGVDKKGTKQAEEIDEEVHPLYCRMLWHEDPTPSLMMICFLIYVTCVDLISLYLVTN